eukprot:3216422-Amphidinium_carterae.1
MLALSLLLSDGATVLDGQQSQSLLHDQLIDGRGCYYLNLSTLDTCSSHGRRTRTAGGVAET